MRLLLSAVLSLLLAGTATAQTNDASNGSGIAIGGGDILTNWHVVKSCDRPVARMPGDAEQNAVLVAHDERNDLAVIRVGRPARATATFRRGSPVRAGETIVASGYPLSGVLASTANISTGIVNALAGLGDDSRYLQISAPVQPGNSGGPLVDQAGRVVGIVTAKLNAIAVARYTGDIPQNVNFAIKAEIARTFLESHGIDAAAAVSDRQMSVPDVADMAKSFTVFIGCRGRPAPAPDSRPTTRAGATRVALYEEDPGDPAGKRYEGTAVWRIDHGSSGAGDASDTVVRADFAVPSRRITVTWSLRLNSDKALPASHTVDIDFKLPPNYARGGVANVPGMLTKETEEKRGMPLIGLSVKVTTGHFLIGLSGVAAEMQRNIALLQSEGWLDIPIVYSDGRRAILAVEKGAPGQRVLAEAFAAWGQTTAGRQ